jgi:predicted GTPase
MAQMKVEAFMRGAAMDPEGQYAAAATADGQLYLWDLKQIDQGKGKEELKKSITCKVRGAQLFFVLCDVLDAASDVRRGRGEAVQATDSKAAGDSNRAEQRGLCHMFVGIGVNSVLWGFPDVLLPAGTGGP